MLSGVAAENEAGLVERREGQSSPSKPHGEQPPPLKPYGEQSPPLQPHGEHPPPFQPHGKQPPPQQPQSEKTSPMPGFIGHGPGSVRLLPPRRGKKQPVSVVTMSSDNGTTFLAQTTTQVEEGSSSLSEKVEAAQPNAGPHPPSIPPEQPLFPATGGQSRTVRAWYRDDKTCVPYGFDIATSLEGGQRQVFPDSHPMNVLTAARNKRIAQEHNPLMVSRRIEKDGLLLGHITWVKEANGFMEKLVPLSEVEEGMPSSPKKPQGSTPFILTSEQNEERTPLINLMGPEKGTSKSPEGNLEEELSKLLERKRGQRYNESLIGDDEDYLVDFEDEDSEDITVYESNLHREVTDSPAREHPEDRNPFEELRFEQPNGNENRTVTPTSQPVLTKQGIMELVEKGAGGIVPGTAWEQRKQNYCDLLKGYESPTGNTVRASVELAALMVIAAVSENAARVSLTAQREQNEKLVKQAEEHRELVEKEFSESMRRMKAEHDKTIQESARIRDEYAISARMVHGTNDQMI
jgi:hypothetical protein